MMKQQQQQPFLQHKEKRGKDDDNNTMKITQLLYLRTIRRKPKFTIGDRENSFPLFIFQPSLWDEDRA